MAQGLLDLMSEDYELRIVVPEDLAAQITEEIAVTLITEVDYRTGRAMICKISPQKPMA